MSKKATQRKLLPTEAMAVARNLRVAPRKLNLLAGMIRGKKVAEALRALTFSQKMAADPVKKTLASAIANAENNHNLDVDSLVVKEAFVGQGLMLKRFHTRARGRGVRIEKFFSHLTVVVASRTPEEIEQAKAKKQSKLEKSKEHKDGSKG
ncbi:MAG: 50S ribosomal protein L22 [Hydrotalea sp.]|nr:50S ribosomal protein L22 [Hydrotalea sp.]